MNPSQLGTAVAREAAVNMRRVMLPVTAGLLAGVFVGPLARAQAPRLVDSVEAPYAYLAYHGEPATAEGSAGPVSRLLADPALDALFALDANAAPHGGSPSTQSGSPSGAVQSLQFARSMLSRSAGEVEMALTGIVSSGGQPLLVLRARLRPGEASKLQVVLDQAQLVTPHRTLGATTTYRLQRGEGVVDGPGQLVEVAVVGDDLVVGNDGSALREVLDPPTRTSAEPRRVLSTDARFRALRQKVTAPAGSLLLYCDWQRLGRRLQTTLGGVGGQLLGSSGLGSARSVLLSIAPAKADLAATVLLEFAPPETGRAGHGGRGVPDIDGWLAATKPVAARSLVAELPNAGMGGIVLAVDLAAVLNASPRGSHFVWDLREAFDRFGLDFERNVLARLGSRGTVQLHVAEARMADPKVVAAGFTSVYTLRARNKKAAQDLLVDLRRVAESDGRGAVLEGRDRRAGDVLELRHRNGAVVCYVATVDDFVLIAETAEPLLQQQDELRRSRSRSRSDATVTGALQAIGGDQVVGLFDLDLQSWFAGLGSVLAARGDASAADPDSTDKNTTVDLSALPRRHIGYLECIRRADANGDDTTLVRVCVLSSR
jgi:hypothetical protein